MDKIQLNMLIIMEDKGLEMNYHQHKRVDDHKHQEGEQMEGHRKMQQENDYMKTKYYIIIKFIK